MINLTTADIADSTGAHAVLSHLFATKSHKPLMLISNMLNL